MHMHHSSVLQERDRRVADLQAVIRDYADQIHQLQNEVEVSDNHSEALSNFDNLVGEERRY